MKLRKIPLEPLLQILTDLFDSGADYIDISGDNNVDGDELRDIIRITIKPEYMIDSDNDNDDMIEEIEMSYDDDIYIEDQQALSDDDINNLI
jgi:hypothetical protein